MIKPPSQKMMKNFFVFTLNILIGSFLLLSCQAKNQNRSEDIAKNSNPKQEMPTEQAISPQTKSQSASAMLQFSLPSCSGNDCCYNDTNCIKQCDGLFSEVPAKQKCFKRPILLVSEMDKLVSEVLREPEWKNLKNIELSVLLSVLAISEKTWVTEINQYSKTQTREVLYWLAYHSDISTSVFSLYKQLPRLLLVALFRQNTRSPLLDDNAVLSGLKKSIKDEDTFFEVARKKKNRSLIPLVHKQVIEDHLCDYSINQPQPTYLSDSHYEACVLAVYCYLTGSYASGQYSATKEDKRNIGQDLRRYLAGELADSTIENFIQAPIEGGGGLEIIKSADDWPDTACVKLKEIWDDGNLKFGL